MLQDSEPDLPGENARDQQVINSFFNLVAKRTSTWVGKAFSSQAIGCPAPIECSSPQKELALAGAQLFQILSQGPKLVAPMNKAS